ncbi:dihydrolipoamide acetyltransferase family protein [Vulgatibacter incomptus]|uniref:Dihydrolipoamide acetyltransferase component of pyruvate dehydrogenase complex n=1 Tax=Vulgatibacter incomptus TaxID=1391653 RepID=A0A0K1PF57_9BACT|nr:dihydrolipoamide acetyltransferase family protein [Vulgatibacter incomptus]AKU91734.1 Dihydrolipoamide acyltransferase component of branched-chain alpha-keto acid dehydrogenase complex [Vulgatibacter incomptus]
MAKFEFRLPDIGEGVVEGEIVKWLVSVGDTIAEDQALVEVMTDKATVTIPSPKAGKVVERHGNEGEIAKVHGTLVVLETEGGAAEAPAPAAAHAAAPAPAAAAAPKAAPAAEEGRRVLATPVTRRMAREHGVNLAAVVGTGPQGRVTKEDLLGFVSGGAANQAVPAAQPGMQLPPAPAVVATAADQRIPIRGLRRKIAENLVRSKQSAPHYHFVEEVDATDLVALRDRLNAKLAKSGEKLSFLPFIVKAVIGALKKNPRCNAVMDEAAQELVIRGEYNIGIAVATDDGLVVPVIHHADKLSMREIAKEIVRLSDAARNRKLSQADIGGGTFTITSLGQTGGLFATPILNHPEVAIMGVHRMRKRPVVNDAGEIVVRDIMNLSWAFDHRNVDGAEGAKFAYDVIDLVTDPDKLMLEMA